MPSLATTRRVSVLPCAECGEPGPHSFRVEREHGITTLCDPCRPVVHFLAVGETREATEDEGQGLADVAGVHSLHDLSFAGGVQ